MLGRWMKSNTSNLISEELENYWRNQALINQTGTFGPVMLRRTKKLLAICYEMLYISLKTFQDLKLKRWTQLWKLTEEETQKYSIKIITSKMRLQLWFQANLGLIKQLFNQEDFSRKLNTTRPRMLCSFQEVENRMTISLELTRKQDKLLIKVIAMKTNFKTQKLF